jgi:hypothetical protein
MSSKLESNRMYTPFVTSLVACALVLALNGFQPHFLMIPALGFGLGAGLMLARVIGCFTALKRVEQGRYKIRSLVVCEGQLDIDHEARTVQAHGDLTFSTILVNNAGHFVPYVLFTDAFNCSISEGTDPKWGELVVTGVIADPNWWLTDWAIARPEAHRHYQIVLAKGMLSTSFQLRGAERFS